MKSIVVWWKWGFVGWVSIHSCAQMTTARQKSNFGCNLWQWAGGNVFPIRNSQGNHMAKQRWQSSQWYPKNWSLQTLRLSYTQCKPGVLLALISVLYHVLTFGLHNTSEFWTCVNLPPSHLPPDCTVGNTHWNSTDSTPNCPKNLLNQTTFSAYMDLSSIQSPILSLIPVLTGMALHCPVLLV